MDEQEKNSTVYSKIISLIRLRFKKFKHDQFIQFLLRALGEEAKKWQWWPIGIIIIVTESYSSICHENMMDENLHISGKG